ncbi:glycosyltransferase [Listeria booriae]|uniref:Glycosyltransferase n=1 Tax=Listeria booriae TaxID=1552123 RepID=A0A842EVC7_9LIST|nr:glycosyltransferase [Listeria booriae]MBC1888835.1 glycosyltransferase [Listeria booriae]MBC2240438.1 glycosyltransferase [Listeria booriae]
MNWLFAYDHKFYTDGKSVLSKTAFPYKTWERYLKHSDTLTVACRLYPLIEEVQGYSVSSGKKVSFTAIPDASGYAYFMPYNKAIQAMRQAVRQVDAVIARLPSQIGFLAVKVAKELGKPYAVEVVGDPSETYRLHGSFKAKLYAPIAKRTMEKTVEQAPFTLYITEKELQRLYPTKGIQTSCSNTELPNFSRSALLTERKSRDLNKKIVFGMMGSLDSKYKGLDVAIRALARIKKELPDFEFRILGSGASSRWTRIVMQNGLEGVVDFYGTKPSHEVFEWLSDVDIYLQPSRTEGQGRSVIEAMAMGCPVITSDVGGMKELADPAMQFESGNDVALAAIITKVSENHALYCEQIERNYIKSLQFSKHVLTVKREQHYQKFMNWIEGQNK